MDITGLSETPLIALIWFTLWAIALTLFVGLWRVRQVVSGKTAANAFTSGEKHGSDAYWRANRAHMNALENLPIFGVLVLAGIDIGLSAPIFSTLCVVIVFARIVQSLFHLASGSVMFVNLRFTAFLVQIICFIWIAVLILCQLYAA